MSFDNIFESVAAAAIASANMPNISLGRKKRIVIDGSTASLPENTRWKGLGMVSANNTSRLLIDYKAQHPERYQELLQHIFGKDGIAVSHLKLEMGSDINSSSGTEPCVMRSEDEIPDVTRGAGFQLAADAKKINPELTLDMLWWSEPRWVTDSADDMAARYKWYKQTLIAAYETYGLKFDYVSANRNERTIDPAWIVYLAHALKTESNAPYDFSAIKIVASDEESSWATAKKMLEDRSLLDSVDVIGSHYTSHSTDNVRQLIAEHGKEAWFSEACAPMNYAKGALRFDGNGSGLSGIGGALDIANRIITMYPEGGMTMHEFQPVVSAYYDGATYFYKQLITANEPWSGYYELDTGYYMALHFSQFFKKGWTFINSACAGDGVKGGDGHAIVDAVYSYMTACDPDSGDYSIVITNTTSESIIYEFEIKNLAAASKEVNIWETRGPNGGEYDENYFVKTGTMIPSDDNGYLTFQVTVDPNTIVTLSTLYIQRPRCISPDMTEEQRVMKLPYHDDFSYADYGEGFLAARGGAPMYTTDQGGAFEVVGDIGRNVLMQKITEETKADEWGYTPLPVTCLGDDRWYNYSVSCEVKLAEGNSKSIYAGCGLRYNLSGSGQNGWRLLISADGSWEVFRNKSFVSGGSFVLREWNSLKLSAVRNTVTVWINGTMLAEINGDTLGGGSQAAGRAALYSSYHGNCFANLDIEPLGDTDSYYIHRIDCTDSEVRYTGDWLHTISGSFNNYKRTSATGNDGACAEVSFIGTGMALLGENIQDGAVTVEIDGRTVAENLDIPRSDNREVFWSVSGLKRGEHTARITVASGTITLDSIEVMRSAEEALVRESDAETEQAEVTALDIQADEAEEEKCVPLTENAKNRKEEAAEQPDPKRQTPYRKKPETSDRNSTSLAVVPQPKRAKKYSMPLIAAAAGACAAVVAGVIIVAVVSKRKK
ncbi:MAG: glycosyl hydrolase family 59 [Oscillospiraceae bacterium]